MGVTNVWHVLNLRESPFFQDPLTPDDGHYPIDLFVGRRREADLILRGIGSAPHSRHAIQGAPGVGKTTFVQHIKAEVAADGYLAHSDPISVTSATTADDLLLKILGTVHDALVARDESAAKLDPLRDVRQLLDVERTRTLNLSASLAGFGGGVGSGGQRHTGPGAIRVQPAPLLRALGEVATRRMKLPGLLVHLNNLENLAEIDQQQAARIVRDIRDTGLMYPGFHFLLVGTDDAIRTVVAAQEQLRSVFSNPGPLQSLTLEELGELLRKRYDHLRFDPARPWRDPVEPEALGRIYSLFQGNLRGTLHALDEAAKVLVGRGEDATAPMDLPRMRPVLHSIYARKLIADLSPAQVGQIQAVAARGLDARVTQSEMSKAFGLSQSATSVVFSELKRKGYIIDIESAPTGGRGRPRQQYALTGLARLALGGLEN